MIHNFSIKIYDDKNNSLFKEIIINKPRDKASFFIEEGNLHFSLILFILEGFYRVCVELTGFTWEVRQNLFFGLKILSENMDEPQLDKALKTNDTVSLQLVLGKVIETGRYFVDSQMKDLALEDKVATDIMEYTKTVYVIIFVQVLIMFALSGYQLFSYRKVILSNFMY